MSTSDVTDLVKVRSVPQIPADAFHLFTDGFGRWWPRRTHSVGRERSAGVTFPQRVGDQIVETLDDGSTTSWGTVTEYAPPHAVEFTWHPGSTPDDATTVRVIFEPDGKDSGTVVTLTHTGWDRRADGHAARGNYDKGWDVVIGCFVAADL
jgi:uncharacterized protein YndB with AHSA1/START domain